MDTSVKAIKHDLENLKTSATPSKPLDQSTGSDGSAGEESMLLSPSNGNLIAECFDIPDLEVEIERAILQVEKTLKAEKEIEIERRETEVEKEKKARASKPQP